MISKELLDSSQGRKLTYGERQVLMLRYGLGDGYTYTLEECGRIFRITKARIRTIERKALAKLGLKRIVIGNNEFALEKTT